jgi:hypothetical protein
MAVRHNISGHPSAMAIWIMECVGSAAGSGICNSPWKDVPFKIYVSRIYSTVDQGNNHTLATTNLMRTSDV